MYRVALLGVFVLFLDQLTKLLVTTRIALHATHDIFSWLAVTHIQNTGATWGILPNTNGAFIWLSLIAVGVLIYLHDEFTTPLTRISYALLLAGVLGNLIDRIFRGFVVDFISLGFFPYVFNVADTAINVGIALYVIAYFQNSSISDSLSK